MSISDKILMFAQEKENIRYKLNIPKNTPFSEYFKYLPWQGGVTIPNTKLYADFANNRYAKQGVPCNFEDLFTFSRAGTAWLVKDGELQEYAVDLPRLDDGLLIEQSATNLREWSTDYLQKPLFAANGAVLEGPGDVFSGMASVRVKSGTGNLFQATSSVFTSSATVSYYAKGQNGKELVLALFNSSTSRISFTFVMTGDFIRISGSIPSPANYVQIFDHRPPAKVDSIVPMVEIAGIQYENSTYSSSYIPTSTTPVTRPADFLVNNITGQTVTGDWDSTLTLSIVNGELVHSGYGRIRSLEIN